MRAFQVLAGLLLFLTSIISSALPTSASERAEEILDKRCSPCHTVERVKKKRFTRAGWEKILDQMVTFGARVSGKDRKVLLEYLVATLSLPATAEASGPRAYIVNQDSSDVSIINVRSRKLLGTVPVGKLPHGIAASSDGQFLYVTNMGSNNVTVINAETYATTTMEDTGRNPHEAAFGPVGRFLYVSNPSSNTVTVHDMTTHALVAPITVGQFPHGRPGARRRPP